MSAMKKESGYQMARVPRGLKMAHTKIGQARRKGRDELERMLTAGWESSSQPCYMGRVTCKPKMAPLGQLGLELGHSGEFAMPKRS